MITFLLVAFAVYELIKMWNAESYTGWAIRLRKYELAKKSNPAVSLSEEDKPAVFFIALLNIVYIFVTIWIAIFGANIIAQIVMLAFIIWSFLLGKVVNRLVSLDSVRFRTSITIMDSFLSVIALCVTAYFYQRPM